MRRLMHTWTVLSALANARRTRSAAPPAPGATAAAAVPVRVWDAPVRVVHALLALSFFGAWLSADSESWRLLHVTLGYTAGGLVAFRVLWGLIGTRHARFAGFVRGPGAVMRYLRSLAGPQPEHHVGHNPAGGWAIVGLLAGVALLVASGWALYNGVGGEAFEDLHEALGNGLLLLVGVHVAGVLLSSWLHRENLVRAMVTGRKAGTPADAVGRSGWPLAVLIVAGVLGFWAWQWTTAPAPGDLPPAAHVDGGAGGHEGGRSGRGGHPGDRRDRHHDRDHDHD